MGGRLVVIGGDAAGMSAAAEARRTNPALEVVVLEKSRWVSYSACGIPYVIGGDVSSLDQLIVRTPQQLRDQLTIDVRIRHEALSIDLDAGKVEVRNQDLGRRFDLGFDQLLIATGSKPMRPPLPGIDLPFVGGVQTLDDADRLLNHLNHPPSWAPSGVRKVCVVGAGYIGLEMAEAFVQRGSKVTVVTDQPEVMNTLDPDMGGRVSEAMRGIGIEVRCDEPVTGFEPGKIVTEEGTISADLVVLGIGVTPNSEIAGEAGIALGVKDAIVVDRRQHASHEVVWSAGDCTESTNLVSGQKVHVALGTIANRQGRAAGTNIGGGYVTFPGVLGTAVTKVCDVEVGRTGLSLEEAEQAAFQAQATTVDSRTAAGYHPASDPVTVKLVAEENSGRLLGAQIVGGRGAAKRIDVAATAITAGLTLEQVADLDLGYAPPLSPLWDPIAITARKAMRGS